MNQLTMSFAPSLPERFDSLRAFVAHRAAVMEYLAAKYLESDGQRQQRALARMEQMLADLPDLMRQVSEARAKGVA